MFPLNLGIANLVSTADLTIQACHYSVIRTTHRVIVPCCQTWNNELRMQPAARNGATNFTRRTISPHQRQDCAVSPMLAGDSCTTRVGKHAYQTRQISLRRSALGFIFIRTSESAI